jgi:hypothetical protein
VVRIEGYFDVAERVAVTELGKGHAQELAPAGEVPDPFVALVTLDTLVELVARQNMNQLGKDALARIHLGYLPI